MSWNHATEPGAADAVAPAGTRGRAPASASRAGRPRRGQWAGSLALRLTMWSALSAFALVLAATGTLYLALARSLDADNDRLLDDRMSYVGNVLTHADPLRELQVEFETAAAPRQRTPLLFRLIDGDGRVLAEAPGMERRVPAAAFPAPTGEEGHAAEGRVFQAADGARFRLATGTVRGPAGGSKPYVVQAAAALAPQEMLLAAYRARLWLIMSVALVLCIAVGYEVARRGIRPIEQVTQTARRIRATALDSRIEPASMPAELRSLAGEFNEMLDRLAEAFARVSRFSADIAHELRTPVNNLRGVAEVAIAKARDPDEYRDALASTMEEAARLTRIIDALLFLARAEDPRHQVDREPLDVARELSVVAEFYEASASEAGVSIEVSGDAAAPAPIVASANRTLLQRAIGNLLDNALAHTPRGGRITLSTVRTGATVRVVVADTGEGIPPEHLPHVFDRLYRVAGDRSKNTGGTGLGLAIVRSIAASHGGSVEIASSPAGTRVTIVLPVLPLPAAPERATAAADRATADRPAATFTDRAAAAPAPAAPSAQ